MDDLLETLQSKRLEEINFEKINLENITKNFLKQRELIYKKNDALKEEKEASHNRLSKINNDILVLKNSDIKKVTESYQNIIEERKLEIEQIKQFTISETDKVNNKNNILNQVINEKEIEKENNKEKLKATKDSKYFLREKENNLIKKKEKIESHIKIINTKIKNFKNEIKQGLLDNVTRRNEIIQEFINNLDLKKKIEKSKINIRRRINENETKITNFREIKNKERDVILEDYNQRLTSDLPNILEEMENMEKELQIFDIEAEKELYFLKNSLKSLNKKLVNIDIFLNVEISTKAEKINNKSRINEIKSLKKEKNDAEININDIDIDIQFLNNEYESLVSNITELIINEDKNFAELKKKNEETILENNLFLSNLIKEQQNKLNNLELEIKQQEKYLEEEKTNYFSTLQKLEIQREHITSIQDSFDTKMEENKTIIKNNREFFVKQINNIKTRITYLEKQHIELTLKENTLGK